MRASPVVMRASLLFAAGLMVAGSQEVQAQARTAAIAMPASQAVPIDAGRPWGWATRAFMTFAERRVFFCAIDQPDPGSFAHVAEATSAALTIAISTAGRVPALASRLRKELQRLLDEANMPAFFERMARLRREAPPRTRRELLERALRDVRFSGKLELPAPDDDP